MKVKAIKLGYYRHLRQREGSEFVLVPVKGKNGIITPEQQFSPSWMEKIESTKQEPESEDDEVVLQPVKKGKKQAA